MVAIIIKIIIVMLMIIGSSAIPSYVWGIDKEGAYLYSGETNHNDYHNLSITRSSSLKNSFPLVGQPSRETFAQRRVEHKIETRYKKNAIDLRVRKAKDLRKVKSPSTV